MGRANARTGKGLDALLSKYQPIAGNSLSQISLARRVAPWAITPMSSPLRSRGNAPSASSDNPPFGAPGSGFNGALAAAASGVCAGQDSCPVWVVEREKTLRDLIGLSLVLDPRFGWAGSSESLDDYLAAPPPRACILLLGCDLRQPEVWRSFRRLCEARPACRILVFSPLLEVAPLREVFERGVEGYVDRGASLRDVKLGLESLRCGRPGFSPAVREMIADTWDDSAQHGFITQELNAWRGYALGLGDDAVAKDAGFSAVGLQAVKSVLSEKLRVRDEQDFFRAALTHGLILQESSRRSPAAPATGGVNAALATVVRHLACPREISQDPALTLEEKLQRIRTLQKGIHLLPLDSPESLELISLCHEVSNDLIAQLLERRLKNRPPAE